MTEHTVVVLGGGTGGQVATRTLRRRLPATDRVVVVDREATYRFAPSFLWAMTGRRRPEQISRDLRRLARRSIGVVTEDVVKIDPAGHRVRTTGRELSFDRLVISLGAELAPETLPGFAEAAHNLYTLAGALAAGQALRRLRSGRVVVMVSRLPFKCPAAPYEAALLAAAQLRRRGLADHVIVEVYTPEPVPMPTAGPVMGEAVTGLLVARGITLHTHITVEAVDAAASELVLADGRRIGYDLLLGVPPHRAPEVVRASGLAADSGFLPVDPATLATTAADVYAIGDVTAVPLPGGTFLPKAGVFAHHQAKVVAHRIAAELTGKHPTATFDGHGGCFLETGDGTAAYTAGDFYAPDGPRLLLHPPARRWHWAKLAFEQYWLRRWL